MDNIVSCRHFTFLLSEYVYIIMHQRVSYLSGFLSNHVILFDETAGQTVIIGKRPMKGHGREIVQMGVPIIEGPPDDENQRGRSSLYCSTSC